MSQLCLHASSNFLSGVSSAGVMRWLRWCFCRSSIRPVCLELKHKLIVGFPSARWSLAGLGPGWREASMKRPTSTPLTTRAAPVCTTLPLQAWRAVWRWEWSKHWDSPGSSSGLFHWSTFSGEILKAIISLSNSHHFLCPLCFVPVAVNPGRGGPFRRRRGQADTVWPCGAISPHWAGP